jgi:carbon-monoxide dehydrogenase medium subunit
MIPPPFEYVAPKSIPEAIHFLSGDSEAKILAGGQSLIPLLKLRLVSPTLLIDINRIDGLEYIREENGWLRIGALTREASLDRSDLIRSRYPLLADTCRQVADPQVRNLATIGGNLSHADPANDHPAAMLAYGAQVVASGSQGERVIPIEEFFIGPFETALAHDEILTEIRIPASQPGSSGTYHKVERRVGDFAVAAVAVQLQLDPGGACTHAAIGLTNVGLTPIKAKLAGDSLVGRRPDDAAIHQAAALAADAAEPQDDMRGSEAYKRSLVKTITVRALRAALARLNGGGGK